MARIRGLCGRCDDDNGGAVDLEGSKDHPAHRSSVFLCAHDRSVDPDPRSALDMARMDRCLDRVDRIRSLERYQLDARSPAGDREIAARIELIGRFSSRAHRAL